MSLFRKFKDTTGKASMICTKNDNVNCYDCKLGFNYEASLFKTNGFNHKCSYGDLEVEAFIESLGATDTKNMSDIRRWVFMNENTKIDVYSFGGSKEIHIVKH